MITFDASQVERLSELMSGSHKKLKKELMIAVNATATKAKSLMARQIGKELAVAQKEIKPHIKVTKKATSGDIDISATVNIAKTKRLSLRLFGVKQNQAGVTYKISKTKGRQNVLRAFTGPKPGVPAAKLRGHAFVRANFGKGSKRLPIRKLKGPSPWGVFVKKKMTPAQLKEIETELAKQIERRINLNVLRANKLVST